MRASEVEPGQDAASRRPPPAKCRRRARAGRCARYILPSPMLRRIAPLLLALAVAGAPLALELCHIACASVSSQADARTGVQSQGPHAASCHENMDSPAPRSLHASPCGHGDDLLTPAGIGSARHSKVGRSLVAAIPLIGSIAGAP